jgi:sarcosine oxidase subunit beta
MNEAEMFVASDTSASDSFLAVRTDFSRVPSVGRSALLVGTMSAEGRGVASGSYRLDTAQLISKLAAVQHIQETIVVGAGITGLSIALHLAEQGARPIVLERAGVAAGATGVQPGGVRQQWSTRVNCLLGRESLEVYRDLDERLGVSVGATFDPCGYLFLADSPAQLEALRGTVAIQRGAGVPSQLVDPGEAAKLVPGLVVDGVAGGAYCAEDGYFDRPRAVVDAFAAAACARGARIEIGGFRVELADGVRHAARVIVAAGVDTPTLLPALDLPIASVARHLFFSDPLPAGLLRPLVVSPEREFAAKQLADGRILASDLAAAGSPTLSSAGWLRRIRAVIDELLPALAGTEFPTLVSGEYDATPDSQPIIGAVGSDEGLFVAAGFSGHGFMLAPAIGRRVAALALGGRPDAEIRAFSLERFAGEQAPVERQVV